MTYIRVKDVEKIIDRDRNTILRWEREGLIPHPQKDSRGWRFYNEKDIEVIKKYMEAVRKQYANSLNEKAHSNALKS
jgi:DNA-binding transcriptional MerR regulator